jgi:hypothetical protein
VDQETSKIVDFLIQQSIPNNFEIPLVPLVNSLVQTMQTTSTNVGAPIQNMEVDEGW